MAFYQLNSSKSEQTILKQCLVSYIVVSPSETYIDITIASCVINAIFLALGFTLNSIVVVIFSFCKQLRSKLTFFPILVLCCVDLATVMVVHSLFLLQAVTEIRETPQCSYKVAYFSMLYIFPGMSASTLLMMNVERYISIVRPLWHFHIEKKKQKFMCACVLCWLLMVANLACRLYKPSYSKAFTMVGIAIACFLTLFIYVSIFWVARRRRCLRVHEETSANIAQQSEAAVVNRTNFIQDLKIAKMYFLVVILSFICYLPIGIVVFATKYPWRENESRRTLLAQVYTWANTFLSINSTLNCLVFFWANARFREEARKLWKRVIASEQFSNPSSST